MKLTTFDIFPKTIEDFREKTFLGAAISIFSVVVVAYLVIGELMYYLQVERIDELYVDTNSQGKISIYMNISFPSVACDALTLDMMDITGEHELDVSHTMYKTKLDVNGHIIPSTATRMPDKEREKETEELIEQSDELKQLKKAVDEFKKIDKSTSEYCGSCYGSESGDIRCCNSCDEVRVSYRRKGWAFMPGPNVIQCAEETLERRLKASRKEGCNLHGYIMVNKVAGNIHVAPGKSYQDAHRHIHDYLPYELQHFNVSHIIYRLGFGEDYPGLKNPLDNTRKILKQGSGLYQYFIKVVPTLFQFAGGKQLETNQYSVTESFRPRGHTKLVPSVFFMYDLSPIMVSIKETKRSIIGFITSLCAIVGGVFTVAQVLDALLYRATRNKKEN